MTDRALLARNFLQASGVDHFDRRLLAGDASNRRYERLIDGTGGTLVLMDAPPNAGESIGPFVSIARHLGHIGLSAPVILAEDAQNGFLLLEDLGDALFARLIGQEPDREAELYRAATDVLLTLRNSTPPDLEGLSPNRLAAMTDLAFSEYTLSFSGLDAKEAQDRVLEPLAEILRISDTTAPVLALRDYHAENLLWLPERTGVAKVGLLDFQDAFLGHPAYDLVSLLQDARRDVSLSVEQEMIAYYVDQSGLDAEDFSTAYAALGAQRNLRILGVFARLSRKLGKPHYVDLIPRVWSHLMRDLQHPALAPVAEILTTALPEPTSENLAKLRTQ